MASSPSDDLRLAHRLADLAADTATRRISEGFEVRHKPDGTPVTDVDEAVEDELREMLAAERVGDAVLGEERGASGEGSRRWIIDAIDGTSNLVAGSPLWGTLIALEDGDGFVVGVLSAPMFGRRWWAERAGGAWRTKAPAEWERNAQPVRVSARRDLREARATVLPDSAGAVPDAVGAALNGACAVEEAVGQPALLVAEGRLEFSLHLGGGPWDHAALAVIVEEAGGRWSDLSGGRSIETGAVLFSNGLVHDAALQVLAAE